VIDGDSDLTKPEPILMSAAHGTGTELVEDRLYHCPGEERVSHVSRVAVIPSGSLGIVALRSPLIHYPVALYMRRGSQRN
jgi:hypothetical protein